MNLKRIEERLKEYFYRPSLTFLSKDGEKFIHLTSDDSFQCPDIAWNEAKEKYQNVFDQEEILEKMVYLHFYDAYQYYTKFEKKEFLEENLPLIRLLPAELNDNIDENIYIVDILDLKFYFVIYQTSYFINYQTALSKEIVEYLFDLLEERGITISDLLYENILKHYNLCLTTASEGVYALTENEDEPVPMVVLLPVVMNQILTQIDSNEVVIVFSTSHSIAIVDFQVFQNDPNKILDYQKERVSSNIYYYHIDNGISILK